MTPPSEEFELILIPSKNDFPPFSKEYQEELREFSKSAKASAQRGFAMDSISGGGGPLGEFIFNNAPLLITALTTLCGVWLKGRSGRKLRIKVGTTEIEANTIEELNAMVGHINALEENKKKSKK